VDHTDRDCLKKQFGLKLRFFCKARVDFMCEMCVFLRVRKYERSVTEG